MTFSVFLGGCCGVGVPKENIKFGTYTYTCVVGKYQIKAFGT